MRDGEEVIPHVPPATGAEEFTVEGGGEWPDYRVAKYGLAAHDENGILEDQGLPTILYRFKPTQAQRRAIADGQDLFLAVVVGTRAPLPLQLQVGPHGFERQSALLDVTGTPFQMEAGEHQVSRILRASP